MTTASTTPAPKPTPENPRFLQPWISANIPTDDMAWKRAWQMQVFFLRDALEPLVRTGLPYNARVARVIGTHRSKSIILPVVEFARPDLGLRIITRGNFYDWKISVISLGDAAADFTGLFRTSPPPDKAYTGDPLAPVYFEGFPEDLVFGYYDDAPRERKGLVFGYYDDAPRERNGFHDRWSAEIGDEHALWTTIFLIMRAHGAIKPKKWVKRETIDAEMRAEREAEEAEEARQKTEST